MKTSLFKAPECQLTYLKNLFIELTAHNCNQRCRQCYIEFPFSKKVKDFISLDKVREAISDTMEEKIECICLTGAEPMTHPDFNTILRLCLKRTNVCICTNGSFINEKKARFLKRVEDESNFSILVKLSLAHFDEMKNDEVRTRGSFRQVLHASKYLTKYNLTPIISVSNYYGEDEKIMVKNLEEIFTSSQVKIPPQNITVTPWFKGCSSDEVSNTAQIPQNTDCKWGRILTEKGVYTCPFLANDHRGRCGCDFKDYSKKAILESEYCNTCLKSSRQVFGLDFNSSGN